MAKAIKAKKPKTKEKNADFTVVGLYVDNAQTYVGWIRAADIKKAVAKAKKNMAKSNSGDGGSVLAVFFGKHKDVYGEDELYSE